VYFTCFKDIKDFDVDPGRFQKVISYGL